ncbi:MAG: radical SAM protein [Planctomycetota bacterium]
MSGADITLINLNLLYVRYYDTIDREIHVPLGPLYLTQALEEAGFTVDFRDYQLNKYNDPFEIDNIVGFLKNSADIVGFSCMANLLPFTILAIKRFREKYPEKKVILGGVGPKAVERKILEQFPWVQTIAVGECEISAPKLLRALQNKTGLRDVPNLIFRENGRIIQTPTEERIENLDGISFPAFHHINLKEYQGYGMMTSRGCPYPCTFCSVAPIWNHKSYYRSDDNIISEMKLLHEKAGANIFLFQDEFFISGRERVMSFCNALRQSGLKIKWKAFGRVNLVDEEMMRAMKETGCVELRFGIESGSDKILKLTKKGFNSDDALKVISKAVHIFDRVDSFYMWGFPFETMDDFYQSVFQMISLRMMGSRILPSLLCLLPQTELYEEWKTKTTLEFCYELFPEYMFTGHEVCGSARVSIEEKHRPIFDFIKTHPDIFPGFFHIDLKNNIFPKLAVLQQFGFYPADKEPTTDSCGAHSPKVNQAPELATRAINTN